MSWLFTNFEFVFGLALDHIRLSITPIVVGLLLSIPIGWLANRNAKLRGIVLTAGSLLYTVPSLPLFVALPTILGTQITNEINVVIGLSIYAVALMVRSMSDALDSVSPEVKQAASAMGYSDARRFLLVELPLAGPVLLAGIRVVSASSIALVSVGALVGVRSLGSLFTNGFQRNFPEEIIIGIVGTLLIAAVFDLILVTVGRILMPWSRKDGATKNRSQATPARSTEVAA